MGRLGDDMGRLRREIAQWRNNRDELVEELKSNRQCIQHDVAEMQAGFNREHRSRAASMHKKLHEHRHRITAEVEEMREKNARWREKMPDLKGYWQHTRKQFQDRLTETAQQGASRRSAYVSHIRQHIAELQHEFGRFRKTVTQDLEEIRKGWHGDGAQAVPPPAEDIPEATLEVKPDNGVDETAAALPVEEQVVFNFSGEAETVSSDPVTADDLTMIAGIGPERQKRLNEAQIYTFEDLSQQSADDIQSELGKAVKREDAKHWIDQARELTRIG